MPRKSKPWAVITVTPGGPIRTEHTSEAKAYEKVREEVAAMKAGTSRATRGRVEKWEHGDRRDGPGRWVLFDLIDPNDY